MRVLIVDDEPLARDGIRLLLADDSAITAIAEARDGREAVDAILDQRWDLVVLDVQMPELDGFGVIAAVGAERMPPVIFVTAHDRFAIDAFDAAAVDYVRKPVNRERFARAYARAKARRPDPLRGLVDALAAAPLPIARFAVRTAGKTELIEVDAVDWLAAAENYVELHVGAATHLVHGTLTAIAAALAPGAFVRVHRSAIVRIARIATIEPIAHGEYLLTLTTGDTVRTGRTYGDAVRALATNPWP